MSSPVATGRAGLEVTGTLTRAMLEGARRVRPERGRVGKSVRIVVCVVAPLAIGHGLGHIGLGLAVTLGAFAGFHGHVEPYPQRARLVAAMALGYVVAVMAGTLAQEGPVVAVVVTGAFATSAAFVCQALALPAPREYMLVLICLLSGAFPQPLAPPLELAGWTALGGLWAWMVLMSGWLTDRERPEREAVRTALRAIIRLIGAADDNRAVRRHDAVLATRTARRSVEFAGGPTAPLLRDVQLQSEDLLDHALAVRPPGQAMTGEHRTVEGSGGPVPVAASLQPEAPASDRRVLLRRRAGRLIEATDEALPAPGLRRVPRDPDRPPLRSGLWSLRNALGSDSLVPPTALRFGVAVAAGLALGYAIGVPRPYWIPLTTAAVMQGATLMMTARRSIERAAGTGAGIFIAAAIVALNPGAWAIVGGVGAFLFLAEMTIAASYVVAVTFLTPMTLLLSETGAPGTLTDTLIGWRLIDTLIGCALGFLAGRLLWPSRARQQLDRALERALDAIDALLGTDDRDRIAAVGSTTARWMLARDAQSEDELRARRMAAGRGRRGRTAAAQARRASAQEAAEHAPAVGGHRASRHELRVRLLNARSVTDAALGDRFTTSPREDELWPICAAVQQVGYRALARREGAVDDLRREVARLRGELAAR